MTVQFNFSLQPQQKCESFTSHRVLGLARPPQLAASQACKPHQAQQDPCAAVSSSGRPAGAHDLCSLKFGGRTLRPLPGWHLQRVLLGPREAVSGASDAAPAAEAHASAAADERAAGEAGDGNTEQSDQDRHFMQRALQLAQRGVGHTHPNPAVGSVIVQDGKVVGEGFHPKAGLPHAEVYALRAAGQQARGATAYVTLEPCAHYGRTPPCALALVDAGIARVVVGVVDPNPLVGGGGIRILQDAGIEVVAGVEEDSCHAINRDFMERMAAQAAEAPAAEQAPS